ncbi:MAG: TlpA disulfide reductase family protein, partial [Armatimonadota bacterium]
ALRDGDIAAAKAYLLAAGKTPGSPQLNSFGPEMTLAQELIKKSEKETVTEFLDLVRKFWATPPAKTDAPSLSMYTMHNEMLNRWQKEIREGKQPSLNRFDFPAGGTSGDGGTVTAREEPARPALLAAGTIAPDFRALDSNGKVVKLSDYRGKVVVLDFWASWCPPCVASMPHNQAVATKLRNDGVPTVILALDNSEEREPFLAWVRKNPALDALVFAHASPKTARIVGDLYRVSGIPTQYIIDKQGVIRTSLVGFGGPTKALEEAVRAANTAAPIGAKL